MNQQNQMSSLGRLLNKVILSWSGREIRFLSRNRVSERLVSKRKNQFNRRTSSNLAFDMHETFVNFNQMFYNR